MGMRKFIAGSMQHAANRDNKLAAHFAAISDVEKLTRLHRDLHRLLLNFVSFSDLYDPKRPAIFQNGTLYLDGEPNAEDLAATLRLLGVPAAATDYAAFVSHVQEPAEERYLTQVRIVRRVAMVALYDALSEADLRAFPQQKLTVGGLIGKFIETEQQRWGTSLSPQLSKRFGNPGQRFRATLAFGFMIENAFYGVYRIWSRAWLLPQ
jgi:hypothetical protein